MGPTQTYLTLILTLILDLNPNLTWIGETAPVDRNWGQGDRSSLGERLPDADERYREARRRGHSNRSILV